MSDINKPLLIGFLVLLLIVVGVPMLAAFKQARVLMQATPPSGSSPTSAPAASSPSYDAGAAGGSTSTGAPSPGGGVPLNAQTLAGTVWEVSGFEIQLNPDGQAVAPRTPLGFGVTGTWTVSGNTLTVSALGRSISCEIQGDQLVYQGKPIRRIR